MGNRTIEELRCDVSVTAHVSRHVRPSAEDGPSVVIENVSTPSGVVVRALEQGDSEAIFSLSVSQSHQRQCGPVAYGRNCSCPGLWIRFSLSSGRVDPTAMDVGSTNRGTAIHRAMIRLKSLDWVSGRKDSSTGEPCLRHKKHLFK